MKLRKVRLQNFRLHQDTTLDLANTSFCVIRGKNFSGKSSIAQAISLNLTSTTMGLGAAGQGFIDKIKDGEKKSIVTTEIQGQHVLENTVTLNISSTGRTQVVKCLDAPEETRCIKGFENFLSRYGDALKISLNTDYFTRMGEKDQKNLLAKLVLPSRYDFPQDKQMAVAEMIGANQIDFEAEPFAVIELGYKKLYKEREAINRQVKEFDIPEPLQIPKGVDSESLQKELTGIREQREKLQKERDEAVSKANAVEVERGKLQTKIEHLQAEVKKGMDRLKELGSKILPEDGIAALQKVADRSEELENLKKEHDGILGMIQIANQQIERFNEVLGEGSVCPMCDQEINSEKITSLIAALKIETDDADKKIQVLDKKIEAIGDIDAAVASLQAHEDALKEKATLETSLKETVKTGKDTRAELNALGEKQDATLQFNNPLGTLQVKEDKIVEQLRPVITAEERAKDIKVKTEQFEKLEAKAKTLDMLVKWFDKDGIKAKLIAEYIGGFQNKLNSVLSAWSYTASLSNDLSNFNVTTPRGYTGPVKEISGAEEHLFKVAFQCAVSIAAGIKLVVIDEVEELGEDIRQSLYLTVFNLIKDGALEQAILIGYSLDKTVPNPKAPGSKYYWVEDGTVEVLG